MVDKGEDNEEEDKKTTKKYEDENNQEDKELIRQRWDDSFLFYLLHYDLAFIF